VGKIHKQLIDVQKEIKVLHKDSSGYGSGNTPTKYASLFSIYQLIKPILNKHDLGIGFNTIQNRLEPIVVTKETKTRTDYWFSGTLILKIFNVEGETIEFETPISDTMSNGKPNMSIGASVTYGKRFLLGSAFAIAISEKDPEATKEEYDITDDVVSVPETAPETITQQQVVELFNKLHKQSNFEEIKKRNTSIIAN
jgi:hypothetical protein